jgi:signal transduction histidine kinase
MIITFVLLWTITVVVIVNNTMKRDYLRWAAVMTFVAGCGGFGRALIESFLPFLEAYHLSSDFLGLMFYRGYVVCSILNQNLLPYAFFMFSICYSGIFNSRVKWQASFLLLLPIAATLTQIQLSPALMHPFQLMYMWVFPYIVTGAIVLIYSLSKEKNPYIRKDRKFVLLVALPPILSQLVWNYTIRMFGMNDIWRLNSVTIIVLFLIVIGIATRHGFIGIKLKMGNIRLANTMKAVFSGTMVINHTVKNEIAKIKLLSDRIKHHSTVEPDFEKIEKDIEMMHQITQHVLDMANSIQSRIQSIVLNEGHSRMSDLIEQSLFQMTPSLEQKKTRVLTDFSFDAVIRCDRVRIIEVLMNIVSNAVEAIQQAGTLSIQIYSTRKGAVIEISDNGCGISQGEQGFIFDPFYTTKHSEHNFGLGLPYCYNVMREHNGFIKLKSKVGEGTNILLGFPNHRIITVD